MAITLATSAVGAGMSYFQGKEMEKSAEDKIANFKRQTLSNVQEGRSVSTLGAEFRGKQLNTETATYTDALRTAGTRGIIGGYSQAVENVNNVNKDIATNLDMQQKEIDAAIAEDNARIQAMREARDNKELEGYSNLMNVGMGMKYKGINQMVNTLGMAGASAAAISSENVANGGKAGIRGMNTSQILIGG